MTEQSVPRIAPLRMREWSDLQRDAVSALTNLFAGKDSPGAGPIKESNTLGVFVKNPALTKAFLAYNVYLFKNQTLPARLRELIILRAAWLCRCEYEWIQHCIIGKAAGLTEPEISRVTDRTPAAEWSTFDAAALRAVDELWAEARVANATWGILAGGLSEQQLLDFVFTIGTYAAVAMVINSLAVQLEEGVPSLDPALRRKMFGNVDPAY